MNALEIRDVSLRFRQGPDVVTALDGVSISIESGEFVAVTGRSGSGKTSLVNVAGGLVPPDNGAVMVGGIDLASLDRKSLAEVRRRRVGFVFQDLNLISTLTAIENVRLPLELDGARPRKAHTQARDALDKVLGDEVADRFPAELSGGQQQRVAIARALVGTRSLILADEPTGALDELTAEGVMRLLRAQAEAGAAVLLVTHAPGQAAWADRVIRLRDGAIESETTGTTR